MPSTTELEGRALGGQLAETWQAARPAAQARALTRTRALLRVQELRAQGSLWEAAYRQAAADYGVSRAALCRWQRRVNGAEQADWPALLLSNHTGREHLRLNVHDAAWDSFLADYLRPSRPGFAACFRRLVERAKREGWGQLPNLKTLQRRVRREVPASTVLLRREGERALEQCLPAQRRDKSALRALEHVNADGHRLDVFVRWPCHPGHKPRIGRPILVAWQDIYSGKILSWRLDETENSDSVRLAFAEMLRVYGIPLAATVDNGHAFASKRMTGGVLGRHRFKFQAEEPEGIYKAFGVDVRFALPYHGQSKPIERAFRDLCEDIARSPACAGAYTGNAPHAKPADYGSRAVDYEHFVAIVDAGIREHNARSGRRSPVAAGRSFDQVFDESMADELTIVRRATEAQIRWLLLPIEGVKVSKDEAVLTLLGNRFWHPELLQRRGRRLNVRFDPYDLRAGVWVFDGGTDPICFAECIAAVGFTDTDAARRDMRQRRALVKAEKEAAAAFGTVPVHQLAHPARTKQSTTRVVRAEFGRRTPEAVVAESEKRQQQAASEDLLLVLGSAAKQELDRSRGGAA